MMVVSDDLRLTGTDIVEGTGTTRYDGTVTLAALLHRPRLDDATVEAVHEFYDNAAADAASFTVWLAAGGTVRKLAVSMHSADGALELTEVLSPLSAPITPPPADLVEKFKLHG